MGNPSAAAEQIAPEILPGNEPSPDDVDNLTLPPPPYHGGRKGVPLKTIIDKRKRGLSYREIADSVGTSKQSVWQRLKPYEQQLPGMQAKKSSEADLYRITAWSALSYLTPSRLQKTSPYHLALITGILHDHALKAENKYIGDGDIININLSLQEVRERRAALLQALDGAEQAAPESAQDGASPAPAPAEEGAPAPPEGNAQAHATTV